MFHITNHTEICCEIFPQQRARYQLVFRNGAMAADRVQEHAGQPAPGRQRRVLAVDIGVVLSGLWVAPVGNNTVRALNAPVCPSLAGVVAGRLGRCRVLGAPAC